MVTGGSPPYDFQWSNSVFSSDKLNDSISDLLAGSYAVTATDSVGCSQTESFLIAGPTAELILDLDFQNISCFGTNDGFANAIVSGGWPPYTYIWNSTVTTSSLNNLSSGLYNLTVTDSKGCSINDSIRIAQPDRMTVVSLVSTDAGCGSCADGSAQISVSGGTFPYQYSWSNGGSDSIVTGLAPGNYVILVTDDNGCLLSDTVVIGFSTLVISAEQVPQLIISPNPSGGEILLEFTTAISEVVTVKCFNVLGKLVFEDKWEEGTHTLRKYDLSAYDDGIFFIKVETASYFETRKVIISK